MESTTFAKGIIPDGYFGDTSNVTFAFNHETGKTICQHDYGSFTYHIPPAVDVEEALWLLKYHPLSEAKNISRL